MTTESIKIILSEKGYKNPDHMAQKIALSYQFSMSRKESTSAKKSFSHLSKTLDNLAKAMNTFPDKKKMVNDVDRFNLMIELLQEFDDYAKHVVSLLEKVHDSTPKSGPDRTVAKNVATAVAEVYCEHTGKNSIGRSTKRGGYQELLEAIFKALVIEASAEHYTKENQDFRYTSPKKKVRNLKKSGTGFDVLFQ